MKRKVITALLSLVGLLAVAFFVVPWYQQREVARQRELENGLPEAAYEALLNDSGLLIFRKIG